MEKSVLTNKRESQVHCEFCKCTVYRMCGSLVCARVHVQRTKSTETEWESVAHTRSRHLFVFSFLFYFPVPALFRIQWGGAHLQQHQSFDKLPFRRRIRFPKKIKNSIGVLRSAFTLDGRVCFYIYFTRYHSNIRDCVLCLCSGADGTYIDILIAVECQFCLWATMNADNFHGNTVF